MRGQFGNESRQVAFVAAKTMQEHDDPIASFERPGPPDDHVVDGAVSSFVHERLKGGEHEGPRLAARAASIRTSAEARTSRGMSGRTWLANPHERPAASVGGRRHPFCAPSRGVLGSSGRVGLTRSTEVSAPPDTPSAWSLGRARALFREPIPGERRSNAAAR